MKSGSGQLFQALATSAALIGSQVIGIRTWRYTEGGEAGYDCEVQSQVASVLVSFYSVCSTTIHNSRIVS